MQVIQEATSSEAIRRSASHEMLRLYGTQRLIRHVDRSPTISPSPQPHTLFLRYILILFLSASSTKLSMHASRSLMDKTPQ
jgi:hypothetical protein